MVGSTVGYRYNTLYDLIYVWQRAVGSRLGLIQSRRVACSAAAGFPQADVHSCILRRLSGFASHMIGHVLD